MQALYYEVAYAASDFSVAGIDRMSQLEVLIILHHLMSRAPDKKAGGKLGIIPRILMYGGLFPTFRVCGVRVKCLLLGGMPWLSLFKNGD